MKKGAFELKQILTAVIVLIVLVFIIMFLANIKELKEALLKLTSLG
jgi:hypothetical protein